MTIDEINNRIGKLISRNDKNIDKLLRSYERDLVRNYKAALDELKKAIAFMYEKYGENVLYSDMVAYNRLTNLEKEIETQVKQLNRENISTTTEALKEIHQQTYYMTGYAYETSIGAKLGFGLLDSNVIRAAVINPLDWIKWDNRLTPAFSQYVIKNSKSYVQRLRDELTQGLIQGKGYSKIAKTYSDITGMDAYKSFRIMRTEGHRVQSAARLLAYDKTNSAAERLGIKTTKVWVATLDERTRDSHLYMDGKEADPRTGLFRFKSGATTQGPGLSGIPEEDINCRCTDITKIEGLNYKFRRDNINQDVIQNISMDEWTQMKNIKYTPMKAD